MKILFNTYPVAFQKMGGGEKQLEQYYGYLKKKIILQKNLINGPTNKKQKNLT